MFYGSVLIGFIRLALFVSSFLVGTVSFNLFYLNEKLQMLGVINQFHSGRVNFDKQKIDNALTDDFVETGVRYFVQTPEFIYKKNYLKFNSYHRYKFSIEADYAVSLSMFSNSRTSLSLVETHTIYAENKTTPPSAIYSYVTYTFEKTADGYKIKKKKRRL
jgi:hypothetical protein